MKFFTIIIFAILFSLTLLVSEENSKLSSHNVTSNIIGQTIIGQTNTKNLEINSGLLNIIVTENIVKGNENKNKNNKTPLSNPTLPKEFSLSQNYPNPFNPTTTINFALPKDQTRLSLKVYDIKGRELFSLIENKKYQAGRYSVSFNTANQLSTGIYIYKIITDDFTSTKRMSFVK